VLGLLARRVILVPLGLLALMALRVLPARSTPARPDHLLQGPRRPDQDRAPNLTIATPQATRRPRWLRLAGSFARLGYNEVSRALRQQPRLWTTPG